MDLGLCTPCIGYLTKYSNFLCICHTTDDKINLYRELQANSSKSIVKIGNVLRFLLKSLDEGGFNIKKENMKCENEVHIKEEYIDDSVVPIENEPKESPVLYECNNCPYVSTQKAYFNKHIKVHSTDPKDIHNCEICTYKTKNKYALKLHIKAHIADPSTVHKCDRCEYKTTNKSSFNRHLLVHKDKSEIKYYECHLCDFKAKQNYKLTRHHLTIHKEYKIEKKIAIPEQKIHKCEFCAYNTTIKANFNKHLLTHKADSEVEIYKCDICEFQSKFKGNLRSHLTVHKGDADAKTYKCQSCHFKTKHRRSLKCHLATHKPKQHLVPTARIGMFDCNVCDFHTIYEARLKAHLMFHTDQSEFKCQLCDFQTPKERSLKLHLLNHHRSSEGQT